MIVSHIIDSAEQNNKMVLIMSQLINNGEQHGKMVSIVSILMNSGEQKIIWHQMSSHFLSPKQPDVSIEEFDEITGS